MHDATHDRAAGGAVPDLTDLTDTTELDFNGQTITGLGPLSFEAQRGMCLHPSYAVSTDREPLGLLDAWMWACKPKDANGQRRDINESLRWIESYERLAERAVELPQTRLGRTRPELLASLSFDPDEIRAAHVLTNKPMPKELPSLNDRVRRVAMLGGILARQGDGEPGVKTLWTGLQRVTDFAAGLRFLRLSGDTLGCVSWDGSGGRYSTRFERYCCALREAAA